MPALRASRSGPCGEPDARRDAHLLAAPARRGGARARGVGGTRPPRPPDNAVRARPARRALLQRARGSRARGAPQAARRPVRRARVGDARCLSRRPRAAARGRGLRRDSRLGLPVRERRGRAARAGRRAACDQDRASRRRLQLAVARRLPGALDRGPGRGAVRVRPVEDAARGRVRRAGRVANGVEPRRFRPPRAAERQAERRAVGIEGRLAVLTVGGIEPRKGSLTLLDAFARLRELTPDLDPLLLVAGGATLFDYRDELARFEARAATLGVGDEVRRLGNLPDRELERLYRAADLFAFPSVKEGFGLAALEALASGLPVVASELDVFDSFLIHDRTALLAPVGDSEALALALARLAREPRTRERL